MNGFILLLPLFLIRYGFLYLSDKSSLQRAAFFPPAQGKEKMAFLIYQLATLGIFIYSLFSKVRFPAPWFVVATGIYICGIVLCLWATWDFSRKDENGFSQKGLYRFSRNPMYIAYFVYLLGCSLLAQSLVLLLLTVVFQVAGHWVILAEERWCLAEFKDEYIAYFKKVRRYL